MLYVFGTGGAGVADVLSALARRCAALASLLVLASALVLAGMLNPGPPSAPLSRGFS